MIYINRVESLAYKTTMRNETHKQSKAICIYPEPPQTLANHLPDIATNFEAQNPAVYLEHIQQSEAQPTMATLPEALS